MREESFRCNVEAFGSGEEGNKRQEDLKKVRVSLIGGEPLGQYIFASLLGLGIENITYFHASTFSKRLGVSEGTRYFSQVSKELNNAAKTIERIGPFHEGLVYTSRPHIVIDATNSLESKLITSTFTHQYQRQKIMYLSGSSSSTKAGISKWEPWRSKREPKVLLKEFDGKRQGGYASGIAAGLLAEEVRKQVFSYHEGDKPLKNNEQITYNLLSRQRNNENNDFSSEPLANYRNKNVLVVGAGAIANWVTLYLSQMGLGNVNFVDNDHIETKNLNRQVLLRNHVGEMKANTLSKRLAELDPNIKTDFYNMLVQDFVQDKDLKEYDCILGCVDNKEARQFLDKISREQEVCYIDGGTNPRAGHIGCYIPNKTRTIDEQLRLEQLPEGRIGCTNQANPSVVMSNAIIAGFMVGELNYVLLESHQDKVIESPLRYDSCLKQRIYVEPERN